MQHLRCDFAFLGLHEMQGIGRAVRALALGLSDLRWIFASQVTAGLTQRSLMLRQHLGRRHGLALQREHSGAARGGVAVSLGRGACVAVHVGRLPGGEKSKLAAIRSLQQLGQSSKCGPQLGLCRALHGRECRRYF